MKIALASPYDYAVPGGVNNHVSWLASNFSQMGHQVKIIASSSRPQQSYETDNLIVAGKAFPVRSGGSVARINISPRVFFSHRLKNLLGVEKFDILHLHEPFCPTIPLTLLKYSSHEVTVGTFHAFHGRHRAYTYWKPLLKRWYEKLDGKIAVSEPAKDFVSHYFPGNYTIIPNGVDVDHFSAAVAPLEQYHDGKLNILFVGRMEKRKGLDYLLRAYQLLKLELPNSRLIIVGPSAGLRKKKYHNLVAKMRLQDVVFAGYVPYDELARYYHAADIFCAPATGKESFGIVLLEAMAASKPIVASDIEGYAGVISHGVDGLLVPPRDERALALTLLHVLKDADLRQRLAAKGRAKAENHSWRRVAQQVMDYYQTLRLVAQAK